MTAPEWTWNGGLSGGGAPLSTVGRTSSSDPHLTRACRQCCAYLAFRRGNPSAIDASDRVEYAVHLIVGHGFVR